MVVWRHCMAPGAKQEEQEYERQHVKPFPKFGCPPQVREAPCDSVQNIHFQSSAFTPVVASRRTAISIPVLLLPYHPSLLFLPTYPLNRTIPSPRFNNTPTTTAIFRLALHTPSSRTPPHQTPHRPEKTPSRSRRSCRRVRIVLFLRG